MAKINIIDIKTIGDDDARYFLENESDIDAVSNPDGSYTLTIDDYNTLISAIGLQSKLSDFDLSSLNKSQRKKYDRIPYDMICPVSTTKAQYRYLMDHAKPINNN